MLDLALRYQFSFSVFVFKYRLGLHSFPCFIYVLFIGMSFPYTFAFHLGFVSSLKGGGGGGGMLVFPVLIDSVILR